MSYNKINTGAKTHRGEKVPWRVWWKSYWRGTCQRKPALRYVPGKGVVRDVGAG